jgi:hypothetical protein
MQMRRVPQALGCPPHARLVDASDPFTQSKPGQETTAQAEGAPKKDLTSAQALVSSHAQTSLQKISAPIKLTFSVLKAEGLQRAGRRMDEDRASITGAELVRWLLLAAVILAGVGLFFYFGSSTQPVVPPTVQETVR